MLPLLPSVTTSTCSARSGQGHPAGLYPYAVAGPHPPARTRRLEAWVARHRAATTRRAVPRLSVALPAAAPGSDRGRYRACVPGPGARAGLVASGSVSRRLACVVILAGPSPSCASVAIAIATAAAAATCVTTSTL